MPENQGPADPSPRFSGSRFGIPVPVTVTALAVVVLMVLTFAATAAVSTYVFDRVPHTEDELAFVFQARTIAMGRIYVETPPQVDFFAAPFIINRDGKWFGKYPPGYPAVLALGALVGEPWLVNPLAGTLTLLVVYLIAREVYDGRTGLIAMALGLTSPFFLLLSGSLMSHATAMLCFALFVLFFIKTIREQSAMYPFLAGTCLGLAFLNRQLTVVGLALPFALWAIGSLYTGGWKRAADLAMMTGTFLVFVFLLLWYNATLTSSPWTSPYELWWDFDRIGFGKGIGTLGEHTLALGWLNTKENLTLLSRQLFGWPERLSLALIFIPFLLLRPRRWDFLFLLSLGLLVAAYFLYWASGIMYGPRYYFEGLPMLLLLSARGVVVLAERFRDGFGLALGWRPGAAKSGGGAHGPARSVSSPARITRSPATAWANRLGWGLAGGAIVFLAGIGSVTYLPKELARWQNWYGITANPLRSVEKANIHHALVFVVLQNGWEDYGAVFPANSPKLDSDVVYAMDQGSQANAQMAKTYFADRATYILRGTRLDRLAW